MKKIYLIMIGLFLIAGVTGALSLSNNLTFTQEKELILDKIGISKETINIPYECEKIDDKICRVYVEDSGLHKHIKLPYTYCSKENTKGIEELQEQFETGNQTIPEDFEACLEYSEYSEAEMQEKISAKVQTLLNDIADVQTKREVAKEEVNIGAREEILIIVS